MSTASNIPIVYAPDYAARSLQYETNAPGGSEDLISHFRRKRFGKENKSFNESAETIYEYVPRVKFVL